MLSIYRPEVPMLRKLFAPALSHFWEDSLFEPFKEMPWNPRVDLTRENGHYKLTAEIPGIDEKDIQVHVRDGLLTISGEKKREVKEEKDGYTYSERSFGSFSRSFCLPKETDLDRIDAVRTHWPFLRDRRIDAYGDLTRRFLD